MTFKYDELSADVMRTRMDGGVVNKVIAVDIEVALSKDDIYNWISQCKDVETLKWLAAVARRQAERVENPPEDDGDVWS